MDNQASPGLQQLGTPPMQPDVQPVPDFEQPAASVQASQDQNVAFSQIVKRIIEQQEAIIGPIAVEQAKQIQGLAVDWSQGRIDITGNPQRVIDELVEKYKVLFGQIAVQVSREASASILTQIPLDQHPKSLTE